MSNQDGGLRALFKKNIRNTMWQPVETGCIAAGVADSFYCQLIDNRNYQGWIEFKRAEGKNRFKLRPGQYAWAKTYRHFGGNYFLACRRQKADQDQLYILGVNEILEERVQEHHLHFDGGPSNWDWDIVMKAMQVKRDEFDFFLSSDDVKSPNHPSTKVGAH